jgi:MFS family permease
MNTLYLQEVRGYSALHAGLLTLPMAGMAMVFGPVSGRVVGTVGPRVPLLIGGAGIGLSGLLLTNISATTSIAHLLLAYFVFGIGFGFINTPITNTAVSGMPADQAGVAAAVASTSRMVGQSLGVAVIGAVSSVAAGTSLALGFASATHTGWWILVGCAAMIVVLGFVTTGAWARGTAARTAATFERQGVAA